MLIKLDENKHFIQIIEASRLELDQLRYSFTKKLDNWFIIKKRNPNWNCEISFIDSFNRIPFGLWKELVMLCKEFNFALKIDGGINSLIDNTFDENDFREWVNTFFNHPDSSIKPRDYQIEGVIKALKYKKCLEEISTSGGKTFMIYMIFQYLFDRKKISHMLMIVPNLGLIGQAEDDFYSYAAKAGYKPKWTSSCVYSGTRKQEKVNTNITFGTYQSLCKKSHDYFTDVDSVVVDECLHPDTVVTMGDGSTKKITDIIEGDLVYTVNDKTGEKKILPVDYVYHNLSKGNDMYELEMEDGSVLKVTGNHKVLTSEYIWKRVDELNTSDDIIQF